MSAAFVRWHRLFLRNSAVRLQKVLLVKTSLQTCGGGRHEDASSSEEAAISLETTRPYLQTGCVRQVCTRAATFLRRTPNVSLRSLHDESNRLESSGDALVADRLIVEQSHPREVAESEPFACAIGTRESETGPRVTDGGRANDHTYGSDPVTASAADDERRKGLAATHARASAVGELRRGSPAP